MRDRDWLAKWKKRVGAGKAEEISGIARTRGTAVHLLAEKFMLNDPDWAKGAMPFNLQEFRKLRPHLERNVGDIWGIEIPLYSHVLETAGTSDLCCSWKNQKAICDFKTSTRLKTEDDIEHYFIQKTAYSIMVEELFGLKIDKIVTLMIVDHDEPLIFEKDPNDFKDKVTEIFISDRPDIPP
jgi:genome maintenance exonuclease 1